GYCSGGIIAYEMARQLLKSGKKVSLLAMLDSNYYESESKEISINRSFKKTMFFFKSTLKYPRQSYRRLKSKLYKRLPLYQDEITMYGTEINQKYQCAFNRYKIEPLDITVDLFKAQERLSFIEDSQFYGWN